jgi:hypothetical protein
MNDVVAQDGMAVARRIATAVEKKLIKYKASVTQIGVGDFQFVEISLRPPGGGINDDITVAYTNQFFEEATDETLRPKALRILNDFRTLLGLPRDDK